MKLLSIGTIPIPRIYICDGKQDIAFAREHGLPFIVLPRGWDEEKLVKLILFGYLKREFPDIEWRRVLGIDYHTEHRLSEIHVVESGTRTVPERQDHGGIDAGMDVTEDGGYRVTEDGGTLDQTEDHEVDLMDFIGVEWEVGVNVEALQALGIMPAFMDDIATAIRRNLSSVTWMDGWNKKLDSPMGKPGYANEAPNLMVLDVSGSIPGGVALTMVKLIDTLREQANADLIITGRDSWWYPIGSELPSPEVLAGRIGGANEVVSFAHILNTEIAGRHYGNLVVFGDYDAPTQGRFRYDSKHSVKEASKEIEGFATSGTRFDNILAFHTECCDVIPGYGRFAKDVSPDATVEYSHDWTTYIRTRR